MVIVIREGLRMYRRAKRVRKQGFVAYNGTTKDICEQIIKDAYDNEKKYFRVSGGNGHFCEFYVRDFALSCEALVELGYEKEVRSTLEYVIATLRRYRKLTTAISPQGIPFNYFMPAGPDTLAMLLYAITHTHNEDLLDSKTHALNYEFFSEQTIRFAKLFVDEKTLLPRKKLHVSSIRDQAKRNASCYDAVMIAMVAREAKTLRLPFPYTFEHVRDALIKRYWNGVYFFQDQHKQNIVVGDANVLPFWCGVVNDERMREQALDAIHAAELDSPFPLRYINAIDAKREKTSFHFASLLSPDYETHSIWMHLGLAYIRVLLDSSERRHHELARAHLNTYEKNIETYKTFIEVYNDDGTPFVRRFYASDEAMVWVANYLLLVKRIQEKTKNARSSNKL